jgi:transcriptional regulator GlxA family with amidase domain
MRGKTDNMPAVKPAEIGILLYPGVASATVHGLTDLFAVATTIARQHTSVAAMELRVTHWLPSTANDGIDCVFDTHAEDSKSPVAVIVPGSWLGQPDAETRTRLANWLIERHKAGSTLCSVCGGAFILGETGLLARRRATTHWAFLQAFAQAFPDIDVDEQCITVEDGDFLTAGGVLAWTDLGLKLVDRYLGPTIMLETARYMLIDPPGREQRYYSNFSPRLDHGDAPILKVQHWLQSQASAQPSVPEMAAFCVLEERTFLRRFSKATGLTPNEYSQRLRVGKAREMLEFTTRSVSQISREVGYEDVAAFRKVFRTVVGLTPGIYRQRFSVTPDAAAEPRQ